MPSVGFEPTISAGERPQTYALDRAVTGTGHIMSIGVTKSKSLRLVWYEHTIIFTVLKILTKKMALRSDDPAYKVSYQIKKRNFKGDFKQKDSTQQTQKYRRIYFT
jgi:hypothetical protein